MPHLAIPARVDPMIFRSKKRHGGRTAVADRTDLPSPDDSEGIERLLQDVDALVRANREDRDPEIERRILRLRHRAGLGLLASPSDHAEQPAPDDERLPDAHALPEVRPSELTPELLRAAILRSGCLLVRGLVGADDAARLVDGIDSAFQARALEQSGGSAGAAWYLEFEPDPDFEPGPGFDLQSERGWVGANAAGLWVADSPRVMFDMLDVFERVGLRKLATDYLRGRPAISVDKCTLRRVPPDTGGGRSMWHQDGAFLGGDVRALNVWLSLSRCGDVAPGLDIVASRLDHIVPTGTEGAAFDWSVSHAVAESVAGEDGIVRPIFEPGDVLLFDEMCLHSTAADPGMPNARYAIESWFFSPSGFPRDYIPLAF